MIIAFVHSGQALLPEIAAYRRFFATSGIQTTVCLYGSEHESGADILWYFMGLFPKARSKTAAVIHEYSSASVPPLHSLKDFFKGRLNPSPDYRIFHSNYVQAQVNPQDDVPFGYRDQGVNLTEQGKSPQHPLGQQQLSYDFIYSGSCAPQRRLGPLLTCFAEGAVKDRTLLLLGSDYEKLQKQFGRFANITFKGPVSTEEVPSFLSQAKFAINYMPDILPFNVQTSTKLLDYTAAGMPVISSRYEWILRFGERFGGNYFFLNPDLSNLRWKEINDFNYEWPDLRSWTWEAQIRQSGVLAFLKTRFPGGNF